MASWAVMIRKPSDLGYSDDGFVLPPLHIMERCVKVSAPTSGYLFAVEAQTLQERQVARRDSIGDRVNECAGLVNSSAEQFLVWCNLNAESEALTAAIPGAVEVTGSDSDDHKEKSMMAFAAGELPGMISKSSICGFGMNFQVCGDTAYVGMSDSFESIFQSTKRFHRYPRKEPVNRHLIYSQAEGGVYQNVMRKESEFQIMIDEMVEHTKVMMRENVRNLVNERIEYTPETGMTLPVWV